MRPTPSAPDPVASLVATTCTPTSSSSASRSGRGALRHLRFPDVADRIARSVELEDIDVGGIGGTLAGNGLSMAAMRATLERVMTQDAFDHMIPLADARTVSRPGSTLSARGT